jgi:hypothetical protein
VHFGAAAGARCLSHKGTSLLCQPVPHIRRRSGAQNCRASPCRQPRPMEPVGAPLPQWNQRRLHVGGYAGVKRPVPTLRGLTSGHFQLDSTPGLAQALRDGRARPANGSTHGPRASRPLRAQKKSTGVRNPNALEDGRAQGGRDARGPCRDELAQLKAAWAPSTSGSIEASSSELEGGSGMACRAAAASPTTNNSDTANQPATIPSSIMLLKDSMIHSKRSKGPRRRQRNSSGLEGWARRRPLQPSHTGLPRDYLSTCILA